MDVDARPESEPSLGSQEEDALEIPDDVHNMEPDEVLSSLVSIPIPSFPALHRPHQQKKPVRKQAPRTMIISVVCFSLSPHCVTQVMLASMLQMSPVGAPLAHCERVAPERVICTCSQTSNSAFQAMNHANTLLRHQCRMPVRPDRGCNHFPPWSDLLRAPVGDRIQCFISVGCVGFISLNSIPLDPK